MNKQHLISIMKIIENSAATVISDEIYMYLLFDGLKHVSFASISQNAYKRTLVLTGVSKSYLMPGWRVGIAAGPKKIINAMSNIQRERYSCITNIAQSTAAFAFRESSSVKYEMNYIKQIYFKRRSLLEQLISILPNIKWCKPSGTFFALLDFSVWINILSNSNHNIKNDIDLSYRFLNDINVLVFPGSLFGAKNTIRVSLASTSKDLIEGLNRILKWFKLLK